MVNINFYNSKSIISGLFPKELKKAKVILIHKNNSKVEPGNYRPISYQRFLKE